jgi:hypothetical protein
VAQHIDLVPTILDLLGLPVPAGVEGTSLLASGGEGPIGYRPAFSYLDLDGITEQSVTTASWKLIRRGPVGDPSAARALYDDAMGEAVDAAEEHPIVARYLESLARAHAALHPASGPPPQGVLGEEVKERLRALGYLR